MPEHTPAPTPSRSVYGFVLFFCTKTFFFLFIIWALVPEHWFEQINITYLPDRYWAVTIPIIFMTILASFGFIIYPSLSLCMTPDIHDLRTVMDKVTKENLSEKLNSYNEYDNDENMYDVECICELREKCLKKEFIRTHTQPTRCNISMLEDLCIADVSRTLYLK